ncbi:HNH endonuclease, partial [Mycobacterium kansasii]
MAQGKKRRSHRNSGAAAGGTGPATASCLHGAHSHRPALGVETHPPNRSESASIWNRRRVLLLNSTYEPLTALPMRRAVVMVICGK